MKKLLFFIAAVCLTSFAQAQDGIKLGLKAGANLSNFTGDDNEDTKNLLGFHAGAFLDFGISEMVSIRPELLYSMKGVRFDVEAMGSKFEGASRLHYLEVPVLARINADGLFFEFGPTLGYQLGRTNTLEIDGDKVDIDEEGDDDIYKKFELGYAAGLGYQLSSGLGIGLRYQGGVTKVFEDKESKDRNSVFQLSLSYTLGGN